MISINSRAFSVASLGMDLVPMYRRGVALMAIVVRILVAIEPHMYREVLAFHLRQERPLSEVFLASAPTLLAEAERVRPHLIIADEVPSELMEMGSFFWVELSKENALVATISADGYSTTIHNVSLQDFLAVVDKTEEHLAHEA